jgi:hypothetical protein
MQYHAAMRRIATIMLTLLAINAAAMFQGLDSPVPMPGHAAARGSIASDRMGRTDGVAIADGIAQSFARSLGGLLTTNSVNGAGIVPDHSLHYGYAAGSRRVTDVDCLIVGLPTRNIDIGYDAEQRVVRGLRGQTIGSAVASVDEYISRFLQLLGTCG